MSGEIAKGLEGVVIDESRLGNIDGKEGKLWYCGYSIDELVAHSSYEEVFFLLLNQRLPTADELEKVKKELHQNRQLPEEDVNVIADIADSNPMDILRTSISLLASYDDDPNDLEELESKIYHIVAKIPTILAYAYRDRQGLDVVEPREDLSHAANFLYMMHGEKPSEEEAEAMDSAMILYAEHGMNASTFAGVVTASTLASIYSSITSAVNALEGPLHGGATETVMQMIKDVGGPENAESWVEQKLANHEKIPGFGHRVYKATDPRCKHFHDHIQKLASEKDEDWLETIERVRETVEKHLGGKGIWPNTDLYSGTLYRMLGIPEDFYTALFAMSRAAGWCAHIREQISDNRILRPRIRYVGDLDRKYVPVDDR